MNNPSTPFALISNLVKVKSRRLRTIKLLTALGATSLLVSQSSTPVAAALEDSPKTVIDEVWQIISSEFVDPDFNHVDWNVKRQELLRGDYQDQKTAYKAIRQSLEGLGDPYTRFLDPAEYEELSNQTSGELSGIGIRLGIDKETKKLTVFEPIPNSPA
ncbi:MAG: S41 family peptidase, partial [Waterburya sp.]